MNNIDSELSYIYGHMLQGKSCTRVSYDKEKLEHYGFIINFQLDGYYLRFDNKKNFKLLEKFRKQQTKHLKKFFVECFLEKFKPNLFDNDEEIFVPFNIGRI